MVVGAFSGKVFCSMCFRIFSGGLASDGIICDLQGLGSEVQPASQPNQDRGNIVVSENPVTKIAMGMDAGALNVMSAGTDTAGVGSRTNGHEPLKRSDATDANLIGVRAGVGNIDGVSGETEITGGIDGLCGKGLSSSLDPTKIEVPPNQRLMLPIQGRAPLQSAGSAGLCGEQQISTQLSASWALSRQYVEVLLADLSGLISSKSWTSHVSR